MCAKPSGKLYAATNGAAQLLQAFARVERFDFDDALVVTEVEPRVAYVMSGFVGKCSARSAKNPCANSSRRK